MRKRFLSLLLATMCIAASLSACGTKTDSKEETTIKTANANTYKGIDDYSNVESILKSYEYEISKYSDEELDEFKENNEDSASFTAVAFGSKSGLLEFCTWYSFDNEANAYKQFCKMIDTFKEDTKNEDNVAITETTDDFFSSNNGRYYNAIMLYKDKIFTLQSNEEDIVNDIIKKMK